MSAKTNNNTDDCGGYDGIYYQGGVDYIDEFGYTEFVHGDINLITLLMGASNSGLQILNRKNKWISVTALPDQIVVNIGDMLARLTNNKLCSSIHRVVNPPKELWGTSRFSIPFFASWEYTVYSTTPIQ